MKITIVTFNLCTESFGDGANYFFNRAPYIEKKIRKEKPDVLCFQESNMRILDWLKKTFIEYNVVGLGTYQNLGGEANAVAYRKDKFNLFGLDQFWLSPTPSTPGSKFEHQSRWPRVCTTVCLEPKNSGKLFRIYNTHLDHIDAEARLIGINQVLERIAADNEKISLPFVLTGDMNCVPEEVAMKSVLEFGKVSIQEVTSKVPLTFHFFNPERRKEYRIDYIYTTKGLEYNEPVVWDDFYEVGNDRVFLSDHYPVSCEIEFFKD